MPDKSDRTNRATAKNLKRFAKVNRGDIDQDARTFTISLSSEYPVDRGWYQEILSHNPGDIDLSRMNSGGHPFLVNHNPDDMVGVVEKCWLDSDKKLRCKVRCGNSARAQEIFNDISDGIRPNISVGYEHLNELSVEKDATGKETVRFAWRPFEASTVPIPADPTVGVGRGNNISPSHQPKPEISTEDFDRIVTELQNDRTHMPAKFSINPNAQPADNDGFLGLSINDYENYSITRLINCLMKGENCFEREVGQEVQRRAKLPASGIMIPMDVVMGPPSLERKIHTQVRTGPRGKRDLNATTASQGGNFVQTSIYTPIIEILRNRCSVIRMGAKVLSGLSGNVEIPRQTAAATAATLAEQATLTKSTQAISQTPLTPHRVGAFNSYSKQLLIQSTPDCENFVRDDLGRVMSIKLDYLALQGAGGADPLGVKGQPGISNVTFGGAATWAKILEFETDLASNNADRGTMAYITTPLVKSKWKQIAKIGSTFPSFIWEKGNWNDDSADGEVNGLRAVATNNVDNNMVAFGNWEELILGFWGMDIVVDPYTNATSATVNVIVNAFFDTTVRHAASFCWSTDAGNQ